MARYGLTAEAPAAMSIARSWESRGSPETTIIEALIRTPGFDQSVVDGADHQHHRESEHCRHRLRDRTARSGRHHR